VTYHLIYRRRSILERLMPEFVAFDWLDVRLGVWTWEQGLQVNLPFVVIGWEFGKSDFVPVGVTRVEEEVPGEDHWYD
jgi:hypothetical protein